ncbi:uncharacterized protein LOC133531776 isoform X3 [Cydia pomonella]|uniref:uncharacterized protein LOC133531776 isoform X3 n=1 Tax=Cydia pomonella TaxID=82600 RepID=UPI002ADE11DB|nr:uncharacterized protein LOC133531776 isoform X3 [Cydia pomonella]
MSLEGVECVRVKAEPPWEYTELEQPEAQATLTYTVKVEPQCPQSESEVACGVSDASLQLKHEVKEEIEIEVGPEEFHQSKVCRLLPRELASLYTHEQSGTLMAEVKTEPEDDICDSKTHASLYKVHESAQTRHVDYMVKVEDACGVSAARTGEDELVGPEECQKPKEILMSPGPIQREDRRTKQGSKSLRISKKRTRKITNLMPVKTKQSKANSPRLCTEQLVGTNTLQSRADAGMALARVLSTQIDSCSVFLIYHDERACAIESIYLQLPFINVKKIFEKATLPTVA